jgi:hypothetical protein
MRSGELLTKLYICCRAKGHIMNTVSARPQMSFSFLELLDLTFKIYRANFLKIVGFVAVIIIPITVITTILSTTISNSNPATRFAGRGALGGDPTIACLSGIIALIGALLQAVLINAVLTYITSESYWGHKVTIGEAYRATSHRFANLGCGFILVYAVLIALMIPILFLTATCGIAVAGFGLVAYIGIATSSLAPPVLTLENVPAARGVNRAWTLGRSRFWTLLGLFVVIFVLALILQVAVGAVFSLLGTPLLGGTTGGSIILNAVVTAALNILTTPIAPIAMTLLYYDIRSREEGMDLALAALDKSDPRPADLSSPDAGPVITGKDLVNIIILTVGAVVLSFVGGNLFLSIINSIAPGLANLQR